MTLNKRQQVAAGGLILNEAREILFVKRTSKDEFMPGIWEIPGGGIEFTFKCIRIGDDSIVLGKEHDEYKWISPSNFSQLKMTNYMFTLVSKSLKRM